MAKPGNAMKKLLVAMAACELAREKEFDGITVDMICDLAQISRSSFYRLFQDKYEILLWCEDLPFRRGIAQMGRTLTCLEGMTVAFEGFDRFSDLFLSTRNSTERIAREESGKVKAGELILETLESHHKVEIDEALAFQVRWTARNLLDIVVIWSKQERRCAAAELAGLVYPCVPERLRAILDNPVLRTVGGEGEGAKNVDMESLILLGR